MSLNNFLKENNFFNSPGTPCERCQTMPIAGPIIPWDTMCPTPNCIQLVEQGMLQDFKTFLYSLEFNSQLSRAHNSKEKN